MFLIPAVCLAAAVVLALYRKMDLNALRKSLITIAAVQFAVLCVIYFLLLRFAACSDGKIPWHVVMALGLLSYAPLFTKELKLPRVTSFLKKLSVTGLAVLLAECFVFNMKSFTADYQKEIFLPTADNITYENEVMPDGDTLIVSGDANIIVKDLPQYTRAIVVKTVRRRDKSNLPFHVKVSIKDDNFSDNFTIVQESMEMGGNCDMQYSIQPYGELYAVQLAIDSVTLPFTINSIHCMSCLPFAFASLRFWILFLLCGLVIAVIEFQWYRIRYHRRKPLHIGLVAAMILVCVLTTNIFYRPGEESVKYDGTTPSVTDPFAVTFDAMQKGQFYLDLEVDPLLLEVENVYDRSVRDASGARVYWDYAFRDGHFYCYFGITPVVTYYMAYYKLHDKLPTYNMATVFFARLAVLFICLTILAMLRLFCPRPNLILLLLLLPIASAAMGAYWFVTIGGFYNLPNAAGYCFLFLTLWTGLWACYAKKMPLRIVLLLISGTSLALCMGARPTHALCSFVLVPFFIGILLNKRQKLTMRFLQAAVFVIPLCIGMGLIFWYNEQRFGAPLDFGATYQLTVSNINANKMRLSDLWGAIYNYFFLTPQPRSTFPFMEPDYGNLYNFQHYLYVAGTVGWLCYPVIAISVLLMPKVTAGNGMRLRHAQTAGWERIAALILCFTVPVFLAWFDFSMGGVNQRYYFDVAPLLFLGCIAVLLRYVRKPEKNRYFYAIVCLAMAASFILAWIFLICHRDSNMMRRCPDLYNTIENLVIFWQ